MEQKKTDAASYCNILTPEEVEKTFKQIDAGIADSLQAGKAKDQAYANRSELLKRQTVIKTDIDVSESDAFMKAGFDGKNTVVVINGIPVPLTNKENRDLYFQSITAAKRQELAQVEGEIASINSNIAKSGDECIRIEQVNQSIRAKAELQAAMFRYLA
jgi:hypothetical protein